jgi:phospholipase/lecithinase/hemolysin
MCLSNSTCAATTRVSNAKRAAQNLPHVHIMNQFGLNVYDILRYRSLAITQDALVALVARIDAPIYRNGEGTKMRAAAAATAGEQLKRAATGEQLKSS